jgi:hypothetical protein
MTTSLLAGTARRDISPRKPMFLCGYPHVDRISTGVHDPLLATALCLRRGDQSVLLVATDLLFVNPWTAREWRREASARSGVPEAGVFISCSHTHSGPNTCDVMEWGPSPVVPRLDPDYMAFLKQSLSDAAAEAAASLQPARLAWTSAAVDGVGCNRHDPEHGARDPDVSILALRHAVSGRLLALDLTYSMHPTVMHEDSKLVSSDFPGFARQRIQMLAGSDLPILYHTGPAGNQSPRYHVKGQTFGEAERLGGRLAQAVWPAVEAIPDSAFQTEPALRGLLEPVTLPLRTLPAVAEARRTLEAYRATFVKLRAAGAPHGPVRTAECDVFGAEETLFLAECQEKGVFQERMRRYDPQEVQLVQIGDAWLVGYPGELFVEFGLMTKWMAPCRVVPVSLVNGDAEGYLVTPAALREGRYETNNRAFAAEAGGLLVQTALRLLRASQT